MVGCVVMGETAASLKVAMVFMSVALAFSGVFAYAVVKDYTDRGAGVVAANGDAGTPTDAGAPSADASAQAAAAAANGGGGSGTTRSGGNALANTQAASGVTGDSITIGMIYDTQVVDATVELDTVKSYMANVNNAGGINGRKIKVLGCDSQYSPTVTRQCANRMASANVLAVVGMTAPKGEDDQVPYLADQLKIPLVGGLGTPNEFKYHYSYPVSVPFTRYGVAIADQLVAHGIKHPALVNVTDIPWIVPVQAAILKALADKGIYPTHVEAASATDPPPAYTGHVAALMHSSDYDDGHGHKGTCAPPTQTDAGACPDAVIEGLDPFSYTRLFTAMDGAGWHPNNYGVGMDKYTSQKDYGDQLKKAFSVVPFLSPYDNPSNPTVTDYQNSVNTNFPDQYANLDIYTQIAWASAQVFVEGVKRAGSNLTRTSLVQALDSIQGFQTWWSAPVSYSASESYHDPNKCIRFMEHDPQQAKDGGTWRTKSADWVCYPNSKP